MEKRFKMGMIFFNGAALMCSPEEISIFFFDHSEFLKLKLSVSNF
jgi:hypothetical protein